ncbi:MAG: D-glycero-beta-D-manno-heptose 1-phosphate adenylyltransferase [Ornithinibacter sp.]
MALLHAASTLLERLPALDVLVIGDAALDCWSYGRAQRLGREGPVPVVEVDREEQSPGAAANLAANAATLGARVSFAGILGEDPAGSAVLEALGARGVDTSLTVRDATRATVSKNRIVCDGVVAARVDRSGGGSWSAAAREELLRRALPAMRRADLVIIGDYGMGALDDRARRLVAAVRPQVRGALVVDGHYFADWAGCRPTAVTPNAEEVGRLLGRPLPASGRARALMEAGPSLLAASGADLVLATLDEDGGVLLASGCEPHRTAGVPAPPQRTCGAGDTLAAMLGLALAGGLAPQDCADLAAAAASSVVDRLGTCCCSPHDLLRQVAAQLPPVVLDHDELARLVSVRRASGARLVFTNGCFDVLHLGHVRYLREARALGDMLVVAVNSDDSVRRLKGEGRPLVSDLERASLLAALDVVDAVTVFTQDSPRALIEMLRPDLYVKGGDYTPSMLPETPLVERLGGEVVTVGYLADHSTTELIRRMQGERSLSAGQA